MLIIMEECHTVVQGQYFVRKLIFYILKMDQNQSKMDQNQGKMNQNQAEMELFIQANFWILQSRSA